MTKNNKENSPKIIKQLFLLSIPFFGYLAAFIFELNYVSYFGIPSYFIKLTVENIIISIVTVSSGLAIFFFVISFLVPIIDIFYKKRENIVMNLIYLSILQIIAVSIMILPFTDSTLINKFMLFVAIVVYVVFLNFISPLISGKKGKTYIQKLEDENKVELSNRTILDVVTNGNRNFSFVILLLSLVIVLSIRAGSYLASTQESFLTYTSDNSKSVVVREYGQSYILVEIDPETKTIKDNVTIVPNTNKLQFKIEKIGRIKTNKKNYDQK